MPAEKRPGSRVLAGTINQTGALEIDIERFGRDTTFGGAVDVVELGAHARADPVGEGLHH
jgi:Cd2+/Zn2+-exporting ATPase/Cu+-exporting ATPase